MTIGLLVVDMQVDFVNPNAALPVPGALDICHNIARLINDFDANNAPVIFTSDWHSIESPHFQWQGGRWPVHCVRGSEGSAITGRLPMPTSSYMIHKGMSDDGYSAWDGKLLNSDITFPELLRASNIFELFVCGVATDYCVQASVIDLLVHGYETHVILDCVRGVNINPGDSDKALARMLENGADFVLAEKVLHGAS